MREEAVAYLYDFEHTREPGHERSIASYETHLMQYTLGLNRAASPYAFHTIGSTIAFRAAPYAAVRGFPRRAAAEDFYLLSKLAKVGAIDQTPHACLTLSGRSSDRVPFGTGATVARHQTKRLRTYDRRSYSILKVWLDALEESDQSDPTRGFLETLPASLHSYANASLRIIAEFGVAAEIERARSETNSRAAYSRRVHTYFDAFRTMKFVRRLRTLLGEPVIDEECADQRQLGELRQRDRKRRERRPLVGVSQPRHDQAPTTDSP